MQREALSRRSVLSIAGVTLASAGIVTGSTSPGTSDDDEISRDSFTIMDGTDKETSVFVTDAPSDGPTALVLGGVHGNEVAGYVAADEIADWTIDAGTLVTIPEADAVAVDRGTRVDDEGVDLNRQFPVGGEPETDLAQAIWNVISDYEPDVVVDLHESQGIYSGDPVDGVGQAIFHSSSDDAAATADEAADYVNSNYIDSDNYAFETGFSTPDSEPTDLLVHKAADELNADTFLAETLSVEHDLETRVTWHSAIVEQLVDDELFPDEEPDNGHEPDEPVDEEPAEPDDPPEDDEDENGDGEDDEDDEIPSDHEAPIAEIETDPEDADEITLEPEATVSLDATCSYAPDGELVDYEWSVNHDGTFDESGETIDVTVSANGEYTVALRVTDDVGAKDTTEIDLSTE